MPSISKLLDQPFWLDPSDPHRMASAMQINSRRFISQAVRRAWCWPRLCVCEDVRDEVTVTCSPGDPSVDMRVRHQETDDEEEPVQRGADHRRAA